MMPEADRIDPEATYSMGEAMRRKGVALGTIRSALMSGRLPATKDGNRWAIRGADLLAWTPLYRPAPPGLLTTSQAAKAAGVTSQTVRAATRSGALPVRWEAGQRLIDPADLAAWRGRRKQTPTIGPVRSTGVYRMAEIARLLGVSRQAVYQAVSRGWLEAIETDDGPRIYGADLLDWRPQAATPKRVE
jgi:DNA-binding XRE family transcriptional regulator